jgi:hypothetical protein
MPWPAGGKATSPRAAAIGCQRLLCGSKPNRRPAPSRVVRARAAGPGLEVQEATAPQGRIGGFLSLQPGPLCGAPGLRRQRARRWLARDPSRGLPGCPQLVGGRSASSFPAPSLSLVNRRLTGRTATCLSTAPAAARQRAGRSPAPSISIAQGRLTIPETCPPRMLGDRRRSGRAGSGATNPLHCGT